MSDDCNCHPTPGTPQDGGGLQSMLMQRRQTVLAGVGTPTNPQSGCEASKLLRVLSPFEIPPVGDRVVVNAEEPQAFTPGMWVMIHTTPPQHLRVHGVVAKELTLENVKVNAIELPGNRAGKSIPACTLLSAIAEPPQPPSACTDLIPKDAGVEARGLVLASVPAAGETRVCQTRSERVGVRGDNLWAPDAATGQLPLAAKLDPDAAAQFRVAMWDSEGRLVKLSSSVKGVLTVGADGYGRMSPLTEMSAAEVTAGFQHLGISGGEIRIIPSQLVATVVPPVPPVVPTNRTGNASGANAQLVVTLLNKSRVHIYGVAQFNVVGDLAHSQIARNGVPVGTPVSQPQGQVATGQSTYTAVLPPGTYTFTMHAYPGVNDTLTTAMLNGDWIETDDALTP